MPMLVPVRGVLPGRVSDPWLSARMTTSLL